MEVGSRVGGKGERSQVQFLDEVVDMLAASGQEEKTERGADHGRDKRVCVKHQGRIRSMTGGELKHVISEDEDVYVVHGGRISSPGATDRLRNNTSVHVVDNMSGGGKKKKTSKKVEQSDQSTTDKSSSEVDVAFGMMEKCSPTGTGGWSAKMTETMLEMDDEQTEEIMKKMRPAIREEMGIDPEPVIEGMMRFLQERRRREKDQQAEAARGAQQQQQRRREEAARETESTRLSSRVRRSTCFRLKLIA